MIMTAKMSAKGSVRIVDAQEIQIEALREPGVYIDDFDGKELSISYQPKGANKYTHFCLNVTTGKVEMY